MSGGITGIYYTINSGERLFYDGIFPLDTNGEYTIQAYAIDYAGNQSDTVTQTVIVGPSACLSETNVCGEYATGTNQCSSEETCEINTIQLQEMIL